MFSFLVKARRRAVLITTSGRSGGMEGARHFNEPVGLRLNARTVRVLLKAQQTTALDASSKWTQAVLSGVHAKPLDILS